MPGGDRTGPMGEGPMSGRQLGYGAGYDSPGFTRGPLANLKRRFWGRAAGSGRGYGRGFFRPRSYRENDGRDQQNRYQEPFPGDISPGALKLELDQLKDRIEAIKKHLDSIS